MADEIVGALFGCLCKICCNENCWSAVCSTDCCGKCFECPGDCISKSCDCIGSCCKDINCDCCSSFCSGLCSNFLVCTPDKCEKCFDSSCCLGMEENCLRVFNCSDAVHGFSECIHMCCVYEEIKCLCFLRCCCRCWLMNVGYNPSVSYSVQHKQSRSKLERRYQAAQLRNQIWIPSPMWGSGLQPHKPKIKDNRVDEASGNLHTHRESNLEENKTSDPMPAPIKIHKKENNFSDLPPDPNQP